MNDSAHVLLSLKICGLVDEGHVLARLIDFEATPARKFVDVAWPPYWAGDSTLCPFQGFGPKQPAPGRSHLGRSCQLRPRAIRALGCDLWPEDARYSSCFKLSRGSLWLARCDCDAG